MSRSRRSNFIVSDGRQVNKDLTFCALSTAHNVAHLMRHKPDGTRLNNRLYVEVDDSSVSIPCWCIVAGTDTGEVLAYYFDKREARRDCETYVKVGQEFAHVEKRRMILAAAGDPSREFIRRQDDDEPESSDNDEGPGGCTCDQDGFAAGVEGGVSP